MVSIETDGLFFISSQRIAFIASNVLEYFVSIYQVALNLNEMDVDVPVKALLATIRVDLKVNVVFFCSYKEWMFFYLLEYKRTFFLFLVSLEIITICM